MTRQGTFGYRGGTDLPPLVRRAVEAAERVGFDLSCSPQQGRLLRVLAGGVPAGGSIGETGTGCGVGLAWLATGARPGVRVCSVEREPAMVETARRVTADSGAVVIEGDYSALRAAGPFDLLVLDGGGQGKTGDEPIEPHEWLRPGGLLVIDDFTPLTSWPPTYDGRPDAARLHWLEHRELSAAEVRVAPDAATIVATYVGRR